VYFVREIDLGDGGVKGAVDEGVEEPVPDTEDVSDVDGELSGVEASSSSAVLRLFAALSAMVSVVGVGWFLAHQKVLRRKKELRGEQM
jgi:hypothetical protein